jgi:hypothetical protein
LAGLNYSLLSILSRGILLNLKTNNKNMAHLLLSILRNKKAAALRQQLVERHLYSINIEF